MKFKGNYWLEECAYKSWWYIPDPNDPLTITLDDGRVFVLDKVFETDGATTPRFLWGIPGFGSLDWPKAALFHDWLWELRKTRPVVGFLESNRLLYQFVRLLGWSKFVAWSVWFGTTFFGWTWWLKDECTTPDLGSR